MVKASLICGVLAASWPASSLSANRYFTGIGFDDVPSATQASVALRLSADGSVLVGNSQYNSFLWTRDGGFQRIGSIGVQATAARAMSGDGPIAGGFIQLEPHEPNYVAFTFDSSTGETTQLKDPSGKLLPTDIFGLSYDGSVGTGSDLTHAYRWTQAEGAELLIPSVTGGNKPSTYQSYSNGISANGKVIVGEVGVDQGSTGFRWSERKGVELLGTIPDKKGRWQSSEALAVSADGTVVVGDIDTHGKQPPPGQDYARQAFRWTPKGGIHVLGDLPGGGFESYATGVSGDGRIVVGAATTAGGDELFFWDAKHGMRPLWTVLDQDYHLDVSGWDFVGGCDISADGTTIAGNGYDPAGHFEGFVARISDKSNGFAFSVVTPTAVPEPGAIVVFMSVGGIVLRRRLRAKTV